MTFRNNINLSGHVANRHLIRRLLNLDILVADELALFDLQDELTLDLVLLAAHARAFNFGRECFLVDDLVHFHTARIACIDSYLHARLNITTSGNDTLDIDQRTNHIGFDFPHLIKVLLATTLFILSLRNYDQVVLSLQLGRNAIVIQ